MTELTNRLILKSIDFTNIYFGSNEWRNRKKATIKKKNFFTGLLLSFGDLTLTQMSKYVHRDHSSTIKLWSNFVWELYFNEKLAREFKHYMQMAYLNNLKNERGEGYYRNTNCFMDENVLTLTCRDKIIKLELP